MAAKTHREGKLVSTMSVKELQATVKNGGKASQKARNELVKRGKPIQPAE